MKIYCSKQSKEIVTVRVLENAGNVVSDDSQQSSIDVVITKITQV